MPAGKYLGTVRSRGGRLLRILCKARGAARNACSQDGHRAAAYENGKGALVGSRTPRNIPDLRIPETSVPPACLVRSCSEGVDGRG